MRLSPKRCEVIAAHTSRRLLGEGLVGGVDYEPLKVAIERALVEDLSIEDKLSDEVRDILEKNAEQMRDLGVEYHEAFKKIKAKLARDRKLVL